MKNFLKFSDYSKHPLLGRNFAVINFLHLNSKISHRGLYNRLRFSNDYSVRRLNFANHIASLRLGNIGRCFNLPAKMGRESIRYRDDGATASS